MKLVGAFAALFTGTYGHSNMVYPPTWTDRFTSFEMKSDMWFNNDTVVTGARTIPANMKSYNQASFNGEPMNVNPWMRPGTAERREGGYAPCGIGGGNPLGCPIGGGNNCPGGGYGRGQDAFEANLMEGAPVTEWQAGESAEVGFRILANHGGGYSYRLCPVGATETMTEACFQSGALDFDGDTSWIDFDNEGEETRIEFQNARTTVGTPLKADGTPQQWSRNPVPACNAADGGLFQFGGAGCDNRGMCNCRQGTQFPAPAPGVEGYGTHVFSLGVETFTWSVRDQVKVPASLPEGDYVLSFRWDCEQTAQSWATCSSIHVNAAENQVPGGTADPAGSGAGPVNPVTPVAQPPVTAAQPSPGATTEDAPAFQQCQQEELEPAITAGVTGPPLQFRLVRPCRNMGDHLQALQNDPNLPTDTDIICGCVSGFNEAFWAEPPKNCELLPGVTFVQIHRSCAAGIDLNDAKPATPTVTVSPPQGNSCSGQAQATPIRSALSTLSLSSPNCASMEPEFTRLQNTPSANPDYDTLCGCMSGVQRAYWSQDPYQCELTPGKTWVSYYDTCAARQNQPSGRPRNGTPNSNPVPAAGGCDEDAISETMTEEILNNRPEMIVPCLAMNQELQAARETGGQPDADVVCACVGEFNKAWWSQSVFQCELSPETNPGLTFLDIYQQCMDGSTNNGPPGPPINPVNPNSRGGGSTNDGNNGQMSPNQGGNNGGVTVINNTDGDMGSNMVPLYGGALIVIALGVALVAYKRGEKKEQNGQMSYANMGTVSGAMPAPRTTIKGQQTPV